MQKINEELRREIDRMYKEREERKKLQYNEMVNLQKTAKDLLEESTQCEVETTDLHETIYGYCATFKIDDVTIYMYPYNVKNNVRVIQGNCHWEFNSIKSSLYLINNLI